MGINILHASTRYWLNILLLRLLEDAWCTTELASTTRCLSETVPGRCGRAGQRVNCGTVKQRAAQGAYLALTSVFPLSASGACPGTALRDVRSRLGWRNRSLRGRLGHTLLRVGIDWYHAVRATPFRGHV